MDWNPLNWNWFRSRAREDARKAFLAGQVVAREEYVAGLVEDGIEARRRALLASFEAFDYADTLDASDEAKAAVVEAFRSGVAEQAKLIRNLVDRPVLEPGEQEAALEHPFDGSSSSGGSSALPQADRPRALPSGDAEAAPPPAPRKRGRPRKYPRPDEDRNGQG